ncbi:VWD domain-containing protein [Brumimicrobium aurantiacum]|uniref:VWFD domain-containing protein n=1 Tax=Brumimicrobium aurantiacum TaxID=1737063 RepID=A0A3E1EZA9_9FLAO|nr:VWD domain-containing protein [Brumimicrobium aurantiacum]RFC54902.1 hypothetical protein DXU93_03515 [Brumimicrobium aurantiacum]
MKYFTIVFFQILAFSLWAKVENQDVPYERRDSDHLKEVFTAWDEIKGEYLYESMAAMVMREQQPKRPSNLSQTPYELMQSMDDYRVKRISRIASSELDNERNTSRNDQYYWEEWLNYLNSSQCDMNSNGSSNGDPHIRTFDGERYDFQNAGDYLLSASDDNTFMIQTQQVRSSPSIAINGAVAMNINGDLLTFTSVGKDSEKKMIHVNDQEIQNEKSNLVLPQGGVVEYKKNQYLVKWPTGEQLSISKRDFSDQQLFDLKLYIPECKENYYGLLGNNDDEKNDIVAYDQETGKELTREKASREKVDVFGSNRTNPEILSEASAELFFITRTFGSQFQLDSTNSLMRNQMTNIPDSIRYPKEVLTLAQLEDDEIEEGLRKAKEAGVAEEDLFGAVYDYGHLGLEPVALKDVYEAPKTTDKGTEPKIDNEREAKDKKGNSEIRINPSVFIGVGGKVSPPKRRRPPSTPRPGGVRGVPGKR